jgi:hypothetical protein
VEASASGTGADWGTAQTAKAGENLALFEAYQTVQTSSLVALKDDIAKGVADVHDGRVAEMDMASIKAQGRAILKAKSLK